MTAASGALVGVDVGGTKIAVGVVDTEGRVQGRARGATPPAAEIPAAVAALVAEAAQGEPVAAVGIGAAGFVASDRRTVLTASNIGWSDAPVAAQVEELVGAPVVVENDANAAAWGEYRFGAGAGSRHVLMVTVGTGVGGGVVLDGQLRRGAHGVAAEVGHVRFERDGLLCGCGQRGCLEQYASGTALVRRAREAGLVDLDGPEITRRALVGDRTARRVLADLGADLGEGLASLVAVLDPDVVVVGGGVAAAGDHLLDAVRLSLARHLTGGEERPGPVVRAALLGNDAGLVGAADLAGAHGDA
ncbi:MAG: ROK family protein [Aeromicrobium sp.]|uniref:ROK family protein n=1 Tax=Aeromicrobium sp. TaxID=1871063 RepID=UPI0039E3500A